MSAYNTKELIAEIDLFIEYAVPGKDLEKARKLVKKNCNNLLILRLLREHYAVLPGDREEAVEQIVLLKHKQGVYLYVVCSASYSSLYLVSLDTVVWLNEYGQEAGKEILNYFDYKNQKEFLKDCKPVGKLKEFSDQRVADKAYCPVCNVIEGEYHLLGCVVEVCPWCEWQLNSCNCRFDQLKIEEFEDEEQVEEFADLLEAKGRIPFAKDQRPAYPGTSDGLDVTEQ